MTSTRSTDLVDLPSYDPIQTVTGTLRAWGDDAFVRLWIGWTEAFGARHPQAEFSHYLRGTSTAVGALYTGTADIGLFGREIRKLERTSWKRIFSHQPLGFTVATGAYDTFAKTVAVAVLVNDANPLQGITFKQLDALYGAERRRGADRPITTWGQLGLTGDWAAKPIRCYGLDPDTGTAQHVRTRVLDEGPWSANAVLPPGAPTTMYAGSGGHASDALIAALASDPYAIGLAGFRNVHPGIRALEVAENDHAFVAGTRESTRTREYPLSRSVYAFVREAPETTWNPAVREFLRFILSREGQEVVDSEGDYQPLPRSYVEAERARLETLSSST